MSTEDLGALIDAVYNLREARLGREKEIKELKEKENEVKNAILELLSTSGLQKATGLIATASIKRAIVPMVTKWDDIFQYIKENDRFDLVQKRIGVLAWRGLYEDNILVPGTEAVEDIDLSLTKASRGI